MLNHRTCGNGGSICPFQFRPDAVGYISVAEITNVAQGGSIVPSFVIDAR